MINSVSRTIMTILGLFLFMSFNAQSQQADALLGKWLNEDKDAQIHIYKEDGKFYGKVVWLKNPNEEDTGLPKLDDENKDETLRDRPVMGLILLKDFVYDSDDKEWEDGTIYDPKNGSTYDCYIKFDDEKTLKIRGYIGISWIGRNTYWTWVE